MLPMRTPERRPTMPLCLTLGALLCSAPVLADAPAAPAVGAASAQTLVLQHTVPGDVLKRLHWDRAGGLPVGVTRIRAQPETNSLSVVATPAGFAQVRQIVKTLDVVPRQVQIRFATADAGDADLKASGIAFAPTPGAAMLEQCASGDRAANFLQTLTKRGAVTDLHVVTTTDNVEAQLTLTGAASLTLDATPRVNGDGSVTLALHPIFGDGADRREIKTLRTVKSGDTLVFVMPPAARAAGSKDVLLFVTPTILPESGRPMAMPVK